MLKRMPVRRAYGTPLPTDGRDGLLKINREADRATDSRLHPDHYPPLRQGSGGVLPYGYPASVRSMQDRQLGLSTDGIP
jgi:hypothetical protein